MGWQIFSTVNSDLVWLHCQQAQQWLTSPRDQKQQKSGERDGNMGVFSGGGGDACPLDPKCIYCFNVQKDAPCCRGLQYTCYDTTMQICPLIHNMGLEYGYQTSLITFANPSPQHTHIGKFEISLLAVLGKHLRPFL